MCIKGLIWPHLNPKKLKVAFHQFLLIGSLDEQRERKRSGSYINFTVAVVARNGCSNMLNIEKSSFVPN